MRHARTDVLLACSSGGHLAQMLALRDAWDGFSYVWVTEDTSDARSLLEHEPVVFAHGPTHRNLDNGVFTIARAWLRNIGLALRLVARSRPKVVITTGAAAAVPFAWAARLVGARVVFIESLTRIDTPSFSCRLVAPVADRLYAQWPELRERLPRARYVGSVLSRS